MKLPNCKTCNKLLSDRRNKYCKPCWYQTIHGAGNPAWLGGLPKCKLCSNLVGDRLTRKYCRSCWRKTNTREGNPRWLGGISLEKGYQSTLNNKRRARKKGNGGSHSVKEWIELKTKYNFMCLCCKRFEPEIRITKDHVVSIAMGGSDNITNIQPLCLSCNSKKYSKFKDFRVITDQFVVGRYD